MVKIAIPISENSLSPKFNNCGYYDVFEIEHKQVIAKAREKLCKTNLSDLNEWIVNKGITDVIAHEIDQNMVRYFADTKVNLFIGVKIKSPEQLIDEYLKGTLRSDSHYITI